ncbi:hypothetical protein ABT072_46255 [Streptomyces sp. NPDC002589]|uniref:hypothetical protein n=1 Tax=Streptomyces sp. NPDC002589 TaxID=3154420 RepID=UPI00331B3226
MLSEIQAIYEEVRAFDRCVRDMKEDGIAMSRIPSASLDAYDTEESMEEMED